MTRMLTIVTKTIWPYIRTLSYASICLILSLALWAVTFITLKPKMVLTIERAVVTCDVVSGCWVRHE